MLSILKQGVRVAVFGALIFAAGAVTSNAQSRYYGRGDGYYSGGYYNQARSFRGERSSRYWQLRRQQWRQMAELRRYQRYQRRQLRRALRNDRYYDRRNVYYRSNNRYYNNY